MPSEPTITQRANQPYAGIRRVVTMQTMNEIADRIPEVINWLDGRGVDPSGAPFLRFTVIDMEREMEVEAGVPIAEPVTGDDSVFAGVLPAGRYATLTHVGPPDKLVDATAALLEWAHKQGLEWDMVDSDAGQRWGCRVESYRTNPFVETDPAKWETELAFRLAD